MRHGAPREGVRRIGGPWRASYLDIFIYPETRLDSADPGVLGMRGGVVLFERAGAGTRFLRSLDELYERGPEAKADEELAGLRAWCWKMLERAGREDAEGDHRRHWLLMTLLEDYFVFRGRWYLGTKASLRYLREREPDVYAAFERAMKRDASLGDIERLVLLVAGPRDADSARRALFG